jgi:hypothetical protein
MITFTSTLLDLTILIRHLKPERGNIPVVQQSVKDVLDDLKGDGLVDFDKIGTSNCRFTFPRPRLTCGTCVACEWFWVPFGLR